MPRDIKTTISFDMRSPSWATPTHELYAAAVEMAAYADEIGVDRIGLMEHHGSDETRHKHSYAAAREQNESDAHN